MNFKKLVKSVFCFIFFFITPSFSLYAGMTIFVAQGSKIYAYDVVTGRLIKSYDFEPKMGGYLAYDIVSLCGNRFNENVVYMGLGRHNMVHLRLKWRRTIPPREGDSCNCGHDDCICYNIARYDISTEREPVKKYHGIPSKLLVASPLDESIIYDIRPSLLCWYLIQYSSSGTVKTDWLLRGAEGNKPEGNIFASYLNKDLAFLSTYNEVIAYDFGQKKKIKFDTQEEGYVCAVREIPDTNYVQVIKVCKKQFLCERYKLENEKYTRCSRKILFEYRKKDVFCMGCKTSMFAPHFLITWFSDSSIILYNLENNNSKDIFFEKGFSFTGKENEKRFFIRNMEYDPSRKELVAFVCLDSCDGKTRYKNWLWRYNIETEKDESDMLSRCFNDKPFEIAFSGRFVPDDNDEEERVKFLKNYTKDDLVKNFTTGLDLGEGDGFRSFRSFLI